MGRVLGKLNATAFRAWRRAIFRSTAWKVESRVSRIDYRDPARLYDPRFPLVEVGRPQTMRGQLNRRSKVRWVPRIFYKWHSVTERARRERWQVHPPSPISVLLTCRGTTDSL